MTRDQRRSHENGIWLCPACATLIDRDEAGYPVSLLVAWRTEAETWARSRLNRRPPQESDATNLLAGALAGSPVNLSPSAIRKVHDATSQSLQRLDPRFCVTSAFDGERTSFTLTPREPIAVLIKVPVVPGGEWDRQLSGLHNDGEPAILPMAAVTVTGSPLIEAIIKEGARNDGRLRFSKPPVSVTVTLSTRDRSGREQRLYRGPAEAIGGQSSVTVRTRLFGGAASFEVKLVLPSSAASGTFTFGVDLLKWEGSDVRELAHLDDFSEFAEELGSASDLHVQVHKGGNKLFGAFISAHEFDPLCAGIRRFLAHVLVTREIANGLGRCIRVFNGPCSNSEAATAREIADTIAGRRVLTGSDLSADPTCTVDVQDGAVLDQFLAATEPLVIRYVAQEKSMVQLFGQEIELPPLEITIQATRAKVTRVTPTSRGKSLDIAWLREPDFRCTFRYLTREEQGI